MADGKAGPTDRDWWTIEIDIIPGEDEITGTALNRYQGGIYMVTRKVSEYLPWYLERMDSEHGETWAREYAEGEAIGTVIQRLRDNFEKAQDTNIVDSE